METLGNILEDIDEVVWGPSCSSFLLVQAYF